MLHENLKLLRKEKGLSQEALASRLHVVRQTVSKWEKGVSVPDADLLIQLAEILDAPVSSLLGTTISPTADSNDIAQQLEHLNATLAERNRRNRLIWRVIAIGLCSFLFLSAIITILGVSSYRLTSVQSHVMEVEEGEQYGGSQQLSP